MNIDFSETEKFLTIDEKIRISEIESAKEYLRSTAWLVVESMETGTELDAEVSQKRVDARQTIKDNEVMT